MISGALLPRTRLRSAGEGTDAAWRGAGSEPCRSLRCSPVPLAGPVRTTGSPSAPAAALGTTLTPTKGMSGCWGNATLRNAYLGPILSAGQGAQVGTREQGAMGTGAPRRPHHLPRFSPECWQQGAGNPFLSLQREGHSAHEPRCLPKPSPCALCPHTGTGQKGRSHALHSSARERALI